MTGEPSGHADPGTATTGTKRPVRTADLADIGAQCDITGGLGSVAYQRLLRDDRERAGS
ncbi:hypothetical protein [Bifidobacterium castoris]|uniref:Uncharacterized protein n=1 Tax=Bifidobacterium castoris TaxID=2306972 RepID=A0A430FAD5_9BIFI|nr:hypothetical protein [Bifidobacterium castoris]RSX49779.1 hypothetical protein D2E22_0240 [Bifidobacterium castoris]